MAKHHDIGQKGEALATSFLIKHNYRILETNWRFQKAEIDIIARDENTLVFVEVKTRSSTQFGNPYEFVSQKKQLLYKDAVEAYLSDTHLNLEVRFDIISIVLANTPKIEHLKNAF